MRTGTSARCRMCCRACWEGQAGQQSLAAAAEPAVTWLARAGRRLAGEERLAVALWRVWVNSWPDQRVAAGPAKHVAAGDDLHRTHHGMWPLA